jgi:hypothetical protein
MIPNPRRPDVNQITTMPRVTRLDTWVAENVKMVVELRSTRWRRNKPACVKLDFLAKSLFTTPRRC